MKKLLLCSVISRQFGPPIAFAAFAETGAGLPGFKRPIFAPSGTGMSLGGMGLSKEKVLGRDDTMVGPLPLSHVTREAEGLDRGATGDSLTDQTSINDATTVPLAVSELGLGDDVINTATM